MKRGEQNFIRRLDCPGIIAALRNCIFYSLGVGVSGCASWRGTGRAEFTLV
jgi:hypothetical protein